jgi:hypothetical protein
MLELLKWPEGKIPFIIRDDDVSFFTNSRMLQELYEYAWSKGFVVTFSTIPYILGSIPPFPNVKEPLSHFKYEPCIPPFARGNAKRYKIQDNSELVSFLFEGKKRRICDMTLHGLSHERTEFLSPTKELIEKRLNDAIKIFVDAFNFRPKVFVFPYDITSNLALQVMRQNAIGVCKTPSLFTRALSKARLCKLPSFKFSNNIVEFYHNVSTFSPIIGFHKNVTPFEDAKREFLLRYARKDLFCLAHHYWEFFFDWKEHITQKDMLTALNTFLNYVDSFNIWKCSFNEVSEWLLAFNSILVRRINKDKMIIKTMLPIRNLTFQSTSVCEVRGLKNGPINNREGIWTIENVSPNCLFEVTNT